MNEIIYKSEDTKTNLFITSIKSINISKEIFSFLKIENLLKLIIYNKKLQNKCGYNLEYYKIISGKYRIYNKCGRGEVYKLNTKIKIFEGEYLNGERNGLGKEYYDNGKLKFEGEYLKGKRKGKGKEYYNNDKLEFEKEYFIDNININRREDEENLFNSSILKKDISSFFYRELIYSPFLQHSYLNRERSEKGKKYYIDNKLKFEGEYLNDKRNGKGKEYFDNGILKFEGEYLNGKR